MTKVDWNPFNPKDKSTFPKKEGAYIVTMMDLNGMRFTFTAEWFTRLHRFTKNSVGYRIIAWAEFPKPYEGR